MPGLNKDLAINIWSRIISELGRLQDAASGDFRGQVVNPITQKPHLLDTACAAKVFAVEYARTKDADWHQRAKQAFQSIPILRLASGLEEHIWDGHGWLESAASLPVTGMAFDALWDIMDIAGFEFPEGYASGILDFLATCHNNKGLFAHNSIKGLERLPSVNNTAAVALYLIGYIAHNFPDLKHPLFSEPPLILTRLASGQDKDGYWPYLYPSWPRRLAGALPLSRNRFGAKAYTRYVYYGDTVHHVMTLYFMAKYFLSIRDRNHFIIVKSGWDWVKRNLVIKNNEIEINWSSEPDICAPRYCNLRDTSSYFWILAAIPYLEKLSIIDAKESVEVTNGILLHITKKLLKTNNETPCIIPHEGPVEVLRNILPMFDQGVAWKAYNLSEAVRYYL